MARTFYDSLGINEDIELDLSMLEATGTLLHDESRNHSTATTHATVGGLLWLQTGSWRYGLSINRANPFLDMEQFIDIPAANCPNLNFTSTDYSLAIWFYYEDSGEDDQHIMNKYVVDVSGWEVYLYTSGASRILTVRHHHGGTRTGSYSLGWAYSQWHLFGYSRIGTTGYHYRDGLPITTVSGVLQDPASSAANDFRIGCRFTEDSEWWKARFHRPRAWSRALTADEHRLLFELGYP